MIISIRNLKSMDLSKYLLYNSSLYGEEDFDFHLPLRFQLNRLQMNFREETHIRFITAFRQTRFIERQQVKAYTMDDLVGTCGGYIGMFLGYALIQFPQFLQFIFRTVKQQILARREQQ